MIIKLNPSHTVSDIRRYIVTARPQFSAGNFILQTSFPKKDLVDEATTIKDAGLLNAVVIQRMT